MYGLHPRLVKSFPCINKTCEKSGSPSITTCTLYHTPHLPRDGLVFCRYCKTLTQCFGGLLPGWRVSTCMCYIPGLWDLSHTSTKHVKYTTTHPWPLVPCITIHTSMLMAWWFLQIEPNLDPHLGMSVAWIEGISVYMLHPRLVRPFPCIHKICEMYVNPSMATSTLYHNPHLPGDGVVVCKSCNTLTHIFGGTWPGWRASIYISYIGPRLVRPYQCPHKRCEMHGNPSMITCTLYRIPYIPRDGVLVCRS